MNTIVRTLRSAPQKLHFWPLKGSLRIVGYPDASYRNNEDKSSQRGQVIFLAQPRNRQDGKASDFPRHHSRGSLVDYESTKIRRTTLSTTVAELYSFMKCFGTCQLLRGLWMDISGMAAPIHMRTDANNLVTTASTTHLPEQKETIHMIQMLRKESCSGGLDDLAHVRTEFCLSDCLTKHSAKPDVLIKAIETGILPHVDTHPPFRDLLKHRAYWSQWLHAHLRLPHTSFTFLAEPFKREQAYARRDTWHILDDELVRIHVNPRSTLFTPTHEKCPVDLAFLVLSSHFS